MKTHVSLKVADIKRSIEFYSKMLGTEPVKIKEDYAKFDVANPPLNLTLNKAEVTEGGQLSHLGLQVGSTEDVDLISRRWADEGLITLEEKGTDCCYALQDKVWVSDPDGAHWEVFVVLGDTEGKGNTSKCCETMDSPVSIERNAGAACC